MTKLISCPLQSNTKVSQLKTTEGNRGKNKQRTEIRELVPPICSYTTATCFVPCLSPSHMSGVLYTLWPLTWTDCFFHLAPSGLLGLSKDRGSWKNHWDVSLAAEANTVSLWPATDVEETLRWTRPQIEAPTPSCSLLFQLLLFYV